MSNAKKIFGTFFNAIFRTGLKSQPAGECQGKCQEIVTLNEMPVPEGDFFKLYKHRQRRHNSILALGVFMFASAVTVFHKSEIIKLNFSPPENY